MAAAHGRTGNYSDEWYTPIEIIRALGEFDLDPACGPMCKNRTARRHFEVHGLERKWEGRVWLNPPFSNAKPWVEKFIQHGNGVMLMFNRTDAQWFQDAVRAAGGVFCCRRRINFMRPTGGTTACPLGSVLIPIGEHNHEAVRRSGVPGIFLSLD